jgi:hypothetical protein
MSVTQSLKWLFLIAGIGAALCAPAILVAEKLAWSEWPFHLMQLLAVTLCCFTSLAFLWRTRRSPLSAQRWLAVAAAVLSGLWLSFFVYVLLTLDFSAMG